MLWLSSSNGIISNHLKTNQYEKSPHELLIQGLFVSLEFAKTPKTSMQDIEEIWKDIPGYEGLYQISIAGQVRNSRSGYLLKACINTSGYYHLNLFKQGAIKTVRLHRLLMITFTNNPSNLTDINHKNGLKTDNRLENLEWCSRSYNISHAHAIGIKKSKRGHEHINARLTKDDVLEIRRECVNMKKGLLVSLSNKYGVSVHCIFNAAHKKTYKNIN